MLSEEHIISTLDNDQINQTELQTCLKIREQLTLLAQDLNTLISERGRYNYQQYLGHIKELQGKCTDLVLAMQKFADYEKQMQLTSSIQLIEFGLTSLLLLNDNGWEAGLINGAKCIFSDIQDAKNQVDVIINLSQDQSMTDADQSMTDADQTATTGFNTLPPELSSSILMQGLGPTIKDVGNFFYNFSLIDSQQAAVSKFVEQTLLPKKLATVDENDLVTLRKAFVRYDRLSLLKAIGPGQDLKYLLMEAVRSGLKCTIFLCEKLAEQSTKEEIKSAINDVYDDKLVHTTLLIEAARHGNKQIVAYLVENMSAQIDLAFPVTIYNKMRQPYADGTVPEHLRFQTPLVAALQEGHFEVAAYLLDKIKKSQIKLFNLSSVIHEVILRVCESDKKQKPEFLADLKSFLKENEDSMTMQNIKYDYFERPDQMSRILKPLLVPFSKYETVREEFIDWDGINRFLNSFEALMSIFPTQVGAIDLSEVVKLAIKYRPKLLIPLAQNGVDLTQPLEYWKCVGRFYEPVMERYTPIQLALFRDEQRGMVFPKAALALLQTRLYINPFFAKQCLEAAGTEKDPLLAAWALKYEAVWDEPDRRDIQMTLSLLIDNGELLPESLLEAFIELGNYKRCIYLLNYFSFPINKTMMLELFDLAFKVNKMELVNILLKNAINSECLLPAEVLKTCVEWALNSYNEDCISLLLSINERSPFIDPIVLSKDIERVFPELSTSLFYRYPCLSFDSTELKDKEESFANNHFAFFSSTSSTKQQVNDEQEKKCMEEIEEFTSFIPNRSTTGIKRKFEVFIAGQADSEKDKSGVQPESISDFKWARPY